MLSFSKSKIFARFFSIAFIENGIIRISGVEIAEEDDGKLREIGVKVRRELVVGAAHGIEVIQRNAESKPLFGLFGRFTWKIGSSGASPLMDFRLAESR